jgi:hypothetical protein
VFLRFSMLHQIQMYLLPVNLRLLYVVGIPTILGMLFAGGSAARSRGGRRFIGPLSSCGWRSPRLSASGGANPAFLAGARLRNRLRSAMDRDLRGLPHRL